LKKHAAPETIYRTWEEKEKSENETMGEPIRGKAVEIDAAV
jgi:hypothetical protein